MAHLSLSLLGPFQATLDGRPLTDFKSNKVRALLAYLAVEADRPHRREVLAGLLWPDWPDRDALSNLRSALSNLRRVIGDTSRSGGLPRAEGRAAEPPFLLVTRDTLQLNPDADAWLDVAAFRDLVEAGENHPRIDALKQAVVLYRGGFLEGFSLGDSAPFEEWALLTQEQTARQMSAALHKLAAACEARGEYEEAQSYAWRQLELEPWDEMAHRQLMRALALSGERGAALTQYETCRDILSDELGVEPGGDTTRLYEQIRDGSFSRGAEKRWGRGGVAGSPGPPSGIPAAEPPSFLDEDVTLDVDPPVFVARERELAQLDRFLDGALAGRGRVVFVTGEAGGGKTALMEAFVRRAQDLHADLVVASGSCSAYTGMGDPYSPFRQILGLLTGDVEARWAAGVITAEHARRLWRMLPLTVHALAEHGPDLVDTFVLRQPLLRRATLYETAAGRAGAPDSAPGWERWLDRLRDVVGHRPIGGGLLGTQQVAIFAQYARVVQGLALHAPLVLVLDDLQWADAGSINLLFHLGRQLAGSRVLILGAYRPEEVALGRAGERHPLDPVVNEFRRLFGDICVDLGQAEKRDFVKAFLDSEPNRLGPSFREMLYRQTDGLPLFTIELLRGLQERGDLAQDAEGCWVEGATLDWERLPARVEAVFAERMGRLPTPLQAVLRVASVEGEVFTSEVVAQILGSDEREILRCLSAELDRGHQLVHAQSVQRVDGQLLSCYRFRHILFQRYLYGTLDKVERVHLHHEVGTALERLHGGAEGTGPIAVQLALHFERAGNIEKAIHFLQQAGEKAIQVSANPEAIAHLGRALTLLARLPEPSGEEQRLERSERELALSLALIMARMGGTPGAEWERAATRARELCDQIGKTPELSQVLGQISILHYVRAEYQRARELAQEGLILAEEIGDPLLVALGHWHLGFIFFGLGEQATARAHLERVLSFYDPADHHRAFLQVRGSDAGVSALAYAASCLWCLGYPEQAVERSQEALSLATELGHPFSMADVFCFGGCVLNRMRRNGAGLRRDAEALTRLSRRMGLTSFLGTGICYEGEALAEAGEVEKGIVRMHEGLSTLRSTGTRCYLSGTLGALARAQANNGQPKEGLATLAEALAMVEETGERWFEAELRRLRGELLLAQGDEAQAEVDFLEAIEVARRQSAKSWELRATVSLCLLWQEQGRGEEARRRLAEIYGWFTEGFETPDLQEARALLDELSS